MNKYFSPDRLSHFLEFLESFSVFRIKTVGYSENNYPIRLIQFGSGDYHILMWSQMHGNEPTTTHGLKSLLEWIALRSFSPSEESDDIETILSKTQVSIIMQLNPDGALSYRRENINGIDLNRDAQSLSQTESKILNRLHQELSPDVACNLHDQRTLYAAGSGGLPSAISFLAPAANKQRSITPARKIAMNYIVEITDYISKFIPNRVSRYSDAFNIHCVGDRFTSLGTPTILFEAGFIPGNYHRYTSAQLIYRSLKFLLKTASTSPQTAFSKYSNQYELIPKNEIEYSDILLRNVKINFNDKTSNYKNLFITLKEELVDNKVCFMPVIVKSDGFAPKRAHFTIDCSKLNSLEAKSTNDYLQIMDTDLNHYIQTNIVS